jgi:hypothetical protein
LATYVPIVSGHAPGAYAYFMHPFSLLEWLETMQAGLGSTHA